MDINIDQVSTPKSNGQTGYSNPAKPKAKPAKAPKSKAPKKPAKKR